MATPHVAGAAALLKQQHPDWSYSELKGALTASTKPGAYNPFQQGSGRIAVDRAIAQTVVAEPVSVSFGVQQWPHTDDELTTEKVTYRNLGTSDVTLDLKVTGTGPAGKPAPAGFFTLGADKVTVPAGGTAEVTLTADTRLGGTADGTYSAYLVATGGGQTVRTAAAVEREEESYEVTVKHLGRDGRPAAYADSTLYRFGVESGDPFLSPQVVDGTAKIRVPKGTYVVNSTVYNDPDDVTKGADWIARPKVAVTKNTTLTFDARKAKPVNVKVPDAKAKVRLFSPDYVVEEANSAVSFGWLMESSAGMRTLHAGPKITDGSLAQHWVGTWSKGASTEYDIAVGGTVKQLATGFDRKFTTAQLAKVKIAMGSAAPKKKGSITAFPFLPTQGGSWATSIDQKLPGTRTLYVSTADKAAWSFDFDQQGPADADGWPTYEANYQVGEEARYKAGKTYAKTVNTGVFGPLLDNKNYGVVREGNDITGALPLLADGRGNAGGMLYTSAKTVLYRNGKKLGQNGDPVAAWRVLPGPGGRGRLPADDHRQAQREGQPALHPGGRGLDVPLEEDRVHDAARLHRPVHPGRGRGRPGQGGQDRLGAGEGPRRGRGQEPEVAEDVRQLQRRQDLEEGHRQEGQDHRQEPGQGQGDLVRRQGHRQEGQHLVGEDLQRVLRQVT